MRTFDVAVVRVAARSEHVAESRAQAGLEVLDVDHGHVGARF